MATPEPEKKSMNLWRSATLLLVGMVGGIGLTLWGTQKFGTSPTPIATAPSQATQMGAASPRVAPQSELGTGLPGSVPQSGAVATTISNDSQFRVTLQGCRRTEQEVVCELTITNLTDKEIVFVLNGNNNPKTLAYTDNGLEFEATNIFLGSQSGSFYAQQTLVSQISTPASLKFRNMPQTPQLSLLKIGYRHRSVETGQWVDNTLEFRPVPLTP